MKARSMNVAIGLAAVMIASVSEAKELEAANTWFGVRTATLTPTSLQEGASEGGGTWTAVPSGENGSVTLNTDHRISLNTDHTHPLTYRAQTRTSEPLVRYTIVMTATECESLLETVPGQSKIALCAYTPEGGTIGWYAHMGEGWTRLDGTPDLGATYEILFETNLTEQKIRLSAKKEGASAFVTLKNWVSCPTLTTQAEAISFYGVSTLGDFSSQIVRKVIVADDVDAANYEVVVVSPTGPSAALLVEKSWTAENVPEGQTLQSTCANGLTYLQSYVLGLDPSRPAARPLVTAEQNSETDRLAFRLGGVDVRTTAGARVTYRVKTYDSASADQATETSDSANFDETVKIALPGEGPAVRYYKIEVSVE